MTTCEIISCSKPVQARGLCWQHYQQGRRTGDFDALKVQRDPIASLMRPLTPRGPWERDAACLDAEPETFYPDKGGSTREAKRICESCPVRSECLEYALANDERFGIWGGLSERERRRLQRRAA